jgi:hypothetical protein
MRISHSPRTSKPRATHSLRGVARRLARHVLVVLAAAAGSTLLLALAASQLISSSGGSHRGGAPTRVAGAGVDAFPRPRGAGSAARERLEANAPVLGVPVGVSVAARPIANRAPADFLGLSFELRSLPTIAGYAGRGDLVALLRSLGPGVLRFGGASADEQVAWVGAPPARGRRTPRWASTAIDAQDLAGIAALARASGWRVLLTVGLGHYDPAAAAQEATAAHAALGSALAGVELGNEPDRYAGKHLRARGWDPAAYARQAGAYRAAIARAAPGVPIAAPDAGTGAPGLPWVRYAARALRPALLTDHYYPLSSCGYRPTVAELLSPTVRRAERAMLAAQAAIARAAATPLRVDEANDISCEGRRGVSDTFASALWALDYTAHAIAAGVAGVNFHDLLTKPGAYSPLIAPTPAALVAGALRAQPEWYALLAARDLPGAQPLPTAVRGAAGRSALADELSASAFRTREGRVELVLVDYDPPGSPPLAVRLRIARTSSSAQRGGAYTSGSILRLTGPSPAATAGVRLGGRAVAPDGSWTPPAALPAVYTHAGALAVQMHPSSAAVVTLYPR